MHYTHLCQCLHWMNINCVTWCMIWQCKQVLIICRYINTTRLSRKEDHWIKRKNYNGINLIRRKVIKNIKVSFLLFLWSSLSSSYTATQLLTFSHTNIKIYIVVYTEKTLYQLAKAQQIPHEARQTLFDAAQRAAFCLRVI